MKTASVRSKLILSFMAVAGFVVLSSALAFYTFVFLGQTLDQVTEDRLPPIILAQQLAAQSERIIASAPALIASVKEDERKAVSDAIRTDVDAISRLISQIRHFQGSARMLAAIESDFTQMVTYLRKIDDAVKQKLRIIEESRNIYDELLTTHREFQAIIKPAISIRKHPIGELEEFLGDYGGEVDTGLVRSVGEAVGQLMPLLEIERLGNGLTNFLLSSATEDNMRNLRIIELKGRSRIADIQEQTSRLKAGMAGACAELMIRFKIYAVGDRSLPELRRQELETTGEAQELLEKSRALSEDLNRTVSELIRKTNADIHQATRSAKKTRRLISAILVFVAVASLVFSAFMGWVYVGQQVIRPINRVVHLMRKVSEGDLPESPDIPRADRNRKDEIGSMTNNLILLIDAACETACIAEEIAGGNLSVEVRERSEQDRMMKALNQMIRRLNEILDETGGMILAVGQGRLDVRGNAGAFDGGWRDLVTGVNDLIDGLSNAISKSAALSREMALARKIQTSLLPTSVENIHPDFEIAASMLTADQVGGDFYDITFDKSGYLWLAVGDVSGHGVTSGLIMMMAQTVHATVTANLDCEARDVVVKTNDILYKNVRERLKESHFMTFTALKYLGDGQFEHAGAHLRIIVYRRASARCELIRTRGVYLNLKKDISKPTENSYFRLERGDVMILYTDGLTEARNSSGELLDMDRILKIVGNHARRDAESMRKHVMADVLRWCGNRREDDMTLVIVKRKEEADG
ncbi:SpoIIE family protein phosphatase [Desulfonema ishimotonii]|nr:SpoIIE family protein phosphatase [Desulfonema ishimotonii]